MKIPPTEAAPGERIRLTLRAKGVLAFATLAVYLVAVLWLMGNERDKLLLARAHIDGLHAMEKTIARANVALSHSSFRLQEALNAQDPRPGIRDALLDMQVGEELIRPLAQLRPAVARHAEAVDAGVAAVLAAPSRANAVELHTRQDELVRVLSAAQEQLRERREMLVANDRRQQERITVITVSLGLAGFLAFGAATALFFTRLARDIKELQARSMAIVTEGHAEPLLITRHDEVGGLMQAVNRMQRELRQRDRELEISRQRRFHQEKMAAVGSLAVAIAHEINNPIAAISGIAQSMAQQKTACGCLVADGCQPELIVRHSERIASITRQVAQLTRPHPGAPELVNLNDVVRSACDFIIYDKRFRRIEVSLDLDRDLPAVEIVVDHITQILLNLLINSADALEGVSDRRGAVRVATYVHGDRVSIAVSDNGCGMEKAVLAQAFDESFTTKPPGRGQGVGLFLCKHLIEEGGGNISLESAVGRGTTVSLTLPLAHPQRLAA